MVDLSGGPDGPIEHGFSNTVFIIPGAIIFGLSGSMQQMGSLEYPRPEEVEESSTVFLEEARDLPTETIVRILRGEESLGLHDPRDLEEVLLRRHVESTSGSLAHQDDLGDSLPLYSLPLVFIYVVIFAFVGWKLYQSLKDREKRREEKKMLKQKKKK